MSKDDDKNNITQNEIVGEQSAVIQENSRAINVKSAAIGLVGGVAGALIALGISSSYQGNKQNDVLAKIERQAAYIDELKTDREREFSRVFKSIADLNDKSNLHEIGLDSLENTIHQSQEQQATQLQNITEATINLTEEIDVLKNQIATIEASTLEHAGVTHQAATGAEIVALTQQITALEEKIALLPSLQQQLEVEIKARAALEANLNQQLKNISDMIERQEQTFQELQNIVSLMTAAPPPASDQSMAMLIAANSLKTAIDRGGSYSNELQIFTPLAPADLKLDVLEKYAASGLPNIATLSANFAKLADEIADTEKTLPEGAGLTDQILHQGSQLYSSRPIGDIEGTGAAAIAARMEVAIANGDFDRAMSEAQALPQEARTIAADFLDILQARQTVDALLSRLIATALQEKETTQ